MGFWNKVLETQQKGVLESMLATGGAATHRTVRPQTGIVMSIPEKNKGPGVGSNVMAVYSSCLK